MDFQKFENFWGSLHEWVFFLFAFFQKKYIKISKYGSKHLTDIGGGGARIYVTMENLVGTKHQ